MSIGIPSSSTSIRIELSNLPLSASSASCMGLLKIAPVEKSSATTSSALRAMSFSPSVSPNSSKTSSKFLPEILVPLVDERSAVSRVTAFLAQPSRMGATTESVGESMSPLCVNPITDTSSPPSCFSYKPLHCDASPSALYRLIFLLDGALGSWSATKAKYEPPSRLNTSLL